MPKNQFAVAWWPLSEIVPYEGNPRIIPESAVEKVAASIKAFGWRQPIVVDTAGVIVVGHTRLLAAKRLRLRSAPVHVARGLSTDQLKAYRLADNRVGEETSWNKELLAGELGELQAVSFDLGLAGFDPVELPSADPRFEVLPSSEVRRLDRLVEIECPKCGHRFERRP